MSQFDAKHLQVREVDWNKETIDDEVAIFMKEYVPSLLGDSPSMITSFVPLFSGQAGCAAGILLV